MKTYPIKKELDNGIKIDQEELFTLFDKYRNKYPIIYNIETTNACNMRCKMCPRTTMMTRKIETIEKKVFINIINQIEPHTNEDWLKWEKFVYETYHIPKDEMSENNFFLYIIPKVIQLHGYGDPLLDKNLHEYIRLLTDKGFLSYFSCNPANINIEQTALMLENGLSYIKYSIESVEDEEFKSIRGNASNFTESFKAIKEVIRIKERNNYNTKIIITMLDLNRTGQVNEFKKLSEAFKDLDVYIYLKSEDQQWYRKDYHSTKSVHWSEFCKHPWMSMTIKSNGEAAMCMEDYNNEIILGNAKKENLYDIWNGEKYTKLRKDHFDLTPGIKCTEKCDMKLIGSLYNVT